MTIEFRALVNADDLAPLPAFEMFIWGGASEMVSVNVLVATIEEGGMALGAYDRDLLVGVVYGFATREHHVLHSHYMAVHPDYRGGGLGEQLKRQQAQWCLANGYTSMRWTFDPLQLTNAHLNLNKLGATGVAYRENLYGTLGGINGSLPSDRLVVQWALTGERPTFAETVDFEVPPVTPQEIADSTPEAITARMVVRDFMVPHLDGGWTVTAVDRHARTYTLGR